MWDGGYRQIWYATLAALGLAWTTLWAGGVYIQAGPWGILYAWLGALCILVNGHCASAHEAVRRAVLFLNGILLFATLSLTALLTSYCIARATAIPFVDPWLYAADGMLGFDWRELYRWHVENPWAHIYTRLSYITIGHSPVVLIIGFALAGLYRHMRNFLLVFALALSITVAFFVFLPAESALAFLIGHEPAYWPITQIHAGPTIAGLRDGSLNHFYVHTLVGLITFPSFHAASAVIFAWAAWPLRFVRWPLIAINAAMLVSTPIEGTHYFVDIIGGVLVAMVAIAAVTTLDRNPRMLGWPALAQRQLASSLRRWSRAKPI